MNDKTTAPALKAVPKPPALAGMPHSDGVCMTQTQFEALMRLMRLRKGSKNWIGLNLVLVQGISQYEAARSTGSANSGSISRALTQARACMQDAQELHYPAVRMPTRRRGVRAK